MIQRTLVSTMRQPLKQTAREVSQTLAKVSTQVAAKSTTQDATKAAQHAGQTIAQVSRLAAPPETIWYKIKKSVINFFSNINLGKREVHGVTKEMAQSVLPKMQPGDILLRRTEGTSGNLFIPSWWKHAGVYVGDGQVVDAAFAGVGKNSLEKFMTDGDAIMIVRAKNLTDSQRQAIADYANRQVGKPYDFDFDFTDDARQYCTELANHALKAATGQDLVKKDWFGTVTGDGFMNPNFELVWSSHPEKSIF